MVVAVDVLIPVSNLTEVMETYNTITLYRDTSRTGSFSTLVGTATLVADTHSYTIEDALGSAFWRYKFNHTVSLAETALGPLIETAGTSLRTLRLEAAREGGIGQEGTATGGTALTLIDPLLADSAQDEHYLEGAWIYRPDAAEATDRVRRVAQSGYDVASTTLTVSRAWTNNPANGEVYHVFGLYPPTDMPGAAWSWDRAVRQGLEAVAFETTIDLGVGDGVTTRWDWSPYAAFVDERQIRWVKAMQELDNGERITWRYGDGDTWFSIDRDDVDTAVLELFGPAPTTNDHLLVKAIRTDASLYLDSDITRCPFDRAWRAVLAAAYGKTDALFQPGRYAKEAASAWSDHAMYERQHAPQAIVRGL